MSRIKQTLDALKKERKKALITYLTAGHPDIEATEALVIEMVKKGADIVEIGIPYSDPVADGPVIQKAAQKALDNHIKIKDIMYMVERLRQKTNTPLLYLVYFNCIFQYGMEKFINHCKRVGIDGLIIPDLPYEESQEIRRISAKYDVDIISLVSPTSEERIKRIISDSTGFIYCVSSTGVTGMRKKFEADFETFMQNVNEYGDIPKIIGFGISSPEQVKEIKDYADGVIVGSAIVKMIDEHYLASDRLEKVGAFVTSLKEAVK